MSNDNDFDEKLEHTLEQIEKHVKFVYMAKIRDKLVKMYVTDVEFQDGGFLIDWFCNEPIDEDLETLANNDLAAELLLQMRSKM